VFREHDTAGVFAYEYPRPAVTVDMAVFSLRADDLVILLIRRKKAPFRGSWALPGGFVDQHESLSRAALRELHEETGLSNVRCEQLGAYGDPGRDPRGHTISVAYVTFVIAEAAHIQAGDDAAEVAWVPYSNLDLKKYTSAAAASKPAISRQLSAPKRVSKSVSGAATSVPPNSLRLAFDHAQIIQDARTRLEQHLTSPRTRRTFDLVPENFTLSQLQRVHEVVLGRSVDKRNFRAKLRENDAIEPLGVVQAGRHRPAQLYRWKESS
jgi:8-oxo-dGTP diphosphatase